jgi:hypothetical protein
MTNEEFTQAYGELCDAVNVFYEQVATEPTLAARNIMFHRDRLLDSLEEWHRSTTFHPLNREETTMNPNDLIPTMTPMPKQAKRCVVQALSEISAAVAPVPSGLILFAAIENLLTAMDEYEADAKKAGQG